MPLRLPELIVIFVVALLIFGPKKLPEMGAQIGRSLNAFKKGMSEFNRNPIDDPFDLETFTAQQREIRALEARRLELEILERELSVKRAEAALKATQENVTVYRLEAGVKEDYVAPETVVDADDIPPKETVHTSAESAKAAGPVKDGESVKVAEPVKDGESVKTAEPVKTAESVKVAGSAKDVAVKATESVKDGESVKTAGPVKTAESVKVAETAKDATPVPKANAIPNVPAQVE